MGGSSRFSPIASKIFCSPSLTTLMVRKRPHAVGGGGFVVTDCDLKIVFIVEGCGILGTKGEIVVRDGDGVSVLLLSKRKKSGIIQALSTHNQWNGYIMDDEGKKDLIFSLNEPKPCPTMSNGIFRIHIKTKVQYQDWDCEVAGSFLSRSCTVKDRRGNIMAQVGVEERMNSKAMYQVVVHPGYDQAFVIGVIAVLDNIHGESTVC